MDKLNNKELLELLHSNVANFNEYRREHNNLPIDFSNMTIKITKERYHAHIDNIKMNKSLIYVGDYNKNRFAECYESYKFNNCDLSHSHIMISRESQIIFENCDLSHSKIKSLDLSFDCDVLNFLNCDLTYIDFDGFKLNGTKFDYSDLNCVNFYNARIKWCSFFNVKNLDKANISDEQLSLNFYQRFTIFNNERVKNESLLY